MLCEANRTNSITMRCSAKSTDHEHLISILTNANNHHYSIETCEAPNISYAIIMALTDVISNSIDTSKKHIQLFTNNLYVYNLLTKNLSKWKENNWIGSNGKPIAYVDILCAFADAIKDHELSFDVNWDNTK
jgi:ribonuclease HI